MLQAHANDALLLLEDFVSVSKMVEVIEMSVSYTENSLEESISYNIVASTAVNQLVEGCGDSASSKEPSPLVYASSPNEILAIVTQLRKDCGYRVSHNELFPSECDSNSNVVVELLTDLTKR